jgi:hypothetical protein
MLGFATPTGDQRGYIAASPKIVSEHQISTMAAQPAVPQSGESHAMCYVNCMKLQLQQQNIYSLYIIL